MAVLMVGLYFAFVWSFINYDSSLITLTGTLESGVEAGCVILDADDGTQYLLIGWSNYPPAGTRVTVSGYFDYNVASYCMQGKAAIHVVSISTASTSVSYGTGTATVSSATVISGSTQQSATISGVLITISGYIYEVVETPQCRPQCGAPSFILTYLYIPPGTGCTGSIACYPPPQYYRLLNINGSQFWANAPNGTYATATGTLVTPSSWNCTSLYVPRICMSGDIYVQNLAYSATSQSTATSSTMTTNETITHYVPIPGFEPPSVLVGLILGLAILVVTKRASLHGEESSSFC